MPHPLNEGLRLSEHGFALIEAFEGFRGDWYRDPAGVLTIGFGWTGALPEGLRPPLSRGDARRLLRQSVGAYEAAVRERLAVPVGQAKYDALVSLVYNIGVGAFASSTLLRRLNAAEPDAAEEFDRWVWGGGRILPGLVRRRAAERDLFESDPGG